MSHRFLPAVAAIALLAPSALSASPNLQDGLWEITSKTEMQGMPMAMPMAPVKHTSCLTQKDAVPQKAEKNQQCKILDSRVDGNTVNWSMECRDHGQVVRSTGKVTYAGSSFTGSSQTRIDHPGQGKMQINSQMTGKRVGDCK